MKVFNRQACGAALQLPLPAAWFLRRYDVCRNLVSYGFWFPTLVVGGALYEYRFSIVWVPFGKHTQAVALSVRPPSLWADFCSWFISERVAG